MVKSQRGRHSPFYKAVIAAIPHMNDHETDLAAPQLLVSGASLGHYANVPFKVGETCSQLKLKNYRCHKPLVNSV